MPPMPIYVNPGCRVGRRSLSCHKAVQRLPVFPSLQIEETPPAGPLGPLQCMQAACSGPVVPSVGFVILVGPGQLVHNV